VIADAVSSQAREHGPYMGRVNGPLRLELHYLDLLRICCLASCTANTIRYKKRCYFSVRSKADTSQLNLLRGNPQRIYAIEFELK